MLAEITFTGNGSELEGEKPQCPYCRSQFDSMDNLNLHIVSRHTALDLAELVKQTPSGSFDKTRR